MLKIWTIAVKDTLIRFRDRNALIFMLAAPLIISAIMGAAFGGVSGGSSPIFNIPLIIVNQDEGTLGDRFSDVLEAIELDTTDGRQPLFDVVSSDDPEGAREQVGLGQVRGVLFIPANFSEAIEAGDDGVSIELVTDPSANVSPGILRGVVGDIAAEFSSAVITVQTVPDQIVGYQDLLGAGLARFGTVFEEKFEASFGEDGPQSRISMQTVTLGETDTEFNILGYFAPSMAIFFLMFSLFDGTRSILEEEVTGTLHRLMTTPTRVSQILLGKIGGTFLTGLLQIAVLIAASALLFGLNWGDSPLGLILMTLATVAAATSLGAFVAAFARNINQAGIIGTVFTLVFAILGGNFVQVAGFPAWLDFLSKLTINRWALDGFVTLTLGGGQASDILTNVLVLLGLAALFFGLAMATFTRRFVR
jgi:ABC-2 type transport system permease protein